MRKSWSTIHEVARKFNTYPGNLAESHLREQESPVPTHVPVKRSKSILPMYVQELKLKICYSRLAHIPEAFSEDCFKDTSTVQES